jgi:hypothetical protein
MRIATVVLVVVLALAALSSAAFRGAGVRDADGRAHGIAEGGHRAHFQDVAGGGLLVTVDGAVNPEAIPDERAYTHFLTAMASADVATRTAALTKVGLDRPDRAAFVAGLGSLKGDLDAVSAMRRTGESPERVLQSQQAATEGARARIQQTISAVGYQRLEGYIRTNVKRGIRIYRAPMMHRPEAAR